MWGCSLFSEETEDLVSRLHLENLGGSVKIPRGCRINQGNLELDHHYFEKNESLSLLVAGSLRIHEDVTREDLGNGIEYLAAVSSVICPRRLMAT